MIVDTSAIMAVLEDEPDANRLLETMASQACKMALGTWLELSIVADSRSTGHGRRLDDLLTTLEIEVVDDTQQLGRVARVAYQRFGRGSGSPARLNFGDCFAYALSVVTGEPLLFVGDDFAATDVTAAR